MSGNEDFQHKTYRCEWVAEVFPVDQYDKRQHEPVFFEAAFPTREKAQEELERVTTTHPNSSSRRVYPDAPHGYYSCGVRYREVEVSALAMSGNELNVSVKALDDATETKLREALRFSASRSVLSSEDERRVLSALSLQKPEETDYAKATSPYRAALRMVREAIGELFGPAANLESEEAELLRGPEPHHTAEAIIAALQHLKLAALSPQPVEAEPVGYVTTNELTKLRLGVSCVDLFGKVVPKGFDMVPLYASPQPVTKPAMGGGEEKAIEAAARVLDPRAFLEGALYVKQAQEHTRNVIAAYLAALTTGVEEL